MIGLAILGATLGCSAPRQSTPVVLGMVQGNMHQVFDLYSDGKCGASATLPAYTILVPGSPGGVISYDKPSDQYTFCYPGGSRSLGPSPTFLSAHFDGNLLCLTDNDKKSWATQVLSKSPVVHVPASIVIPKEFRWLFPSTAPTDSNPWLQVDDEQLIDCWFDKDRLALLYADGLLKVASNASHYILELKVNGSQIIAVSDKYALVGDKNMGFAKLGFSESHRIRAYEYRSNHLDFEFTLGTRGFVKTGFISGSTINLSQMSAR